MSAERLRAVVPFKRLDRAKSRLALPDVERRELALAMAYDTLAAVSGCAAVDEVVVVTDEAEYAAHARTLGAVVLPDVGALNAGLRAAATGGVLVLALLADLPALTPQQLGRFLGVAAPLAAAGTPCFVADESGLGTTAYVAERAGFDPMFGPDSAARHRVAGAVELTGDWPGLRNDVDDLASLAAVRRLALGPHTRAALSARQASRGDDVSRSRPRA